MQYQRIDIDSSAPTSSSAEWLLDAGGAIGELNAEIERRMAALSRTALNQPLPVDAAHRLSVAAGYGGLLLAVAGLAWTATALF